MARRKPQSQPVATPIDAERRYRWLGRWLLACEPGSPAAALSAQVRAERDRLDRAGLPIVDRLSALERFLDGLGVLDQASAFADRFQLAALRHDATGGASRRSWHRGAPSVHNEPQQKE